MAGVCQLQMVKAFVNSRRGALQVPRNVHCFGIASGVAVASALRDLIPVICHMWEWRVLWLHNRVCVHLHVFCGYVFVAQYQQAFNYVAQFADVSCPVDFLKFGNGVVAYGGFCHT